MQKLKIFRGVILVLLLFPFRLPVSVWFIKLFDYLANLGNEELPLDLVATNVCITKVVYDIVLVVLLVKTIEDLGRAIMGRKAGDGMGSEIPLYWFSWFALFALIIYTVFDGQWTYELFFYMNK